MEYKIFKQHLLFKEKEIIVPKLNISISKDLFIDEDGFNYEKQEEYLKNIYNDNIEKLSKQ